MSIMPTLFISHGAPDIVTRNTPAVVALKTVAKQLPTPKGVVIVSAHWIEDPITMTSGGALKTIHDFAGFDPQLYQIEYPARGDEKISQRIIELLANSDIQSNLDKRRGLDHGAWVPLKILYPKADIPVVQLSLPVATMRELTRYGEALKPLVEEGILIIGSGGSVHNLRTMNLSNQTDNFAIEFEQWLKQSVEGNHLQRLIDDSQYPNDFHMAHPTIEHFAPLVFAWAAASEQATGKRVHTSFDYGNIGMSIYQFSH